MSGTTAFPKPSDFALTSPPGKWAEFMGTVSKVLAKHGVFIRHECVDIHCDQSIVERFNRTLAGS